jgi:NAD-dependent dihydropyrimidine dehydrogenase PreA subunit
MSAAPGARVQVVIYEGAGSRHFIPANRAELFRTLLDQGYAVSSVRGDVASVPASAVTLVLGRFEQQAPATPDSKVRMRNVEGLPAADVLSLVDQVREEAAAPIPGKWKPWFPVIDYKRCTNCMQCLSFCLFDVYGVSPEGKIQVQNQSNCKTDCPACSRVCPEVAILFPKYRHGPIHGGEVHEDDLRREAMKVDISALLGGDIYSLLRDRSAKAKSRFSKERDEDRALKERMNCLSKLQKEMDIPGEVLAALPSIDEIRAKAEAAKARAASVLAPTQPEL